MNENYIEMLILDTCHDCGVKDNELHSFGCDSEYCPLCENQLISCNCLSEWALKNKGLDANKEPYYSKGFPEEVENEWVSTLNRIPMNSAKELKIKIKLYRNCRNYMLKKGEYIE